MDFSLSVTKKTEVDKISTEEKQYVARLVQKIAKTGCNVLLIQKSILRDAVGTLALHFLAKKKILVVTEIERDEIEFVTNSLGCKPIASIDEFSADKLGSAEMVEEKSTPDGRLVFVKGVRGRGRAVSILLRASNRLALAEAERSLHDALCVVRSLVCSPLIVPGGGAAEMEGSVRLREWESELGGAQALCVEGFAEALETIPFTLAENCGLNPVEIVTDLRDRHVAGEGSAGINVRRGKITDLAKERVVQPAKVTLGCVSLATECVQMILKIDEIVHTNKSL